MIEEGASINAASIQSIGSSSSTASDDITDSRYDFPESAKESAKLLLQALDRTDTKREEMRLISAHNYAQRQHMFCLKDAHCLDEPLPGLSTHAEVSLTFFTLEFSQTCSHCLEEEISSCTTVIKMNDDGSFYHTSCISCPDERRLRCKPRGKQTFGIWRSKKPLERWISTVDTSSNA